MKVLIDTSAFYALVDTEDTNHDAANWIVRRLLAEGRELATTSYAVLETAALIQSRLGLRHLALFREALAEAVTIVWVDQALHEAAWDGLEHLGRRAVSLVDCSLAALARRDAIREIIAFDPHFESWGLRLAE